MQLLFSTRSKYDIKNSCKQADDYLMIFIFLLKQESMSLTR